MTPDEHKTRHCALHAALDELLADFLRQTERRLTTTPIMTLMEWSHQQTQQPTDPTTERPTNAVLH